MTRRPRSHHSLSALSLLAIGIAACSSNTTTAPPAGAGDPPTQPAPSPSPDPTGGSSSGAGTSSGNAPLPASWGAEHCGTAAGAKGFAVGQSIGDLVLKDCDTGAEAKLDELCGASATWLFSAHTHCPTCQATAGFTDEVAAAVASKNVAIAHIVYNDNGTSCAKWKAAYKLAGLSNVRVYEDPTGEVWERLKMTNYTAPSAFLDARRVITYKEHGLAKSAVLTQIDAALAAK